ncbi:hypothetical protein B0H14DRAFT_3576311 [Mycena olivaceomarginata]|nr:hypothetical protein B0H14DRAFT_3576311 [Mycena olivaceomarginata]
MYWAVKYFNWSVGPLIPGPRFLRSLFAQGKRWAISGSAKTSHDPPPKNQSGCSAVPVSDAEDDKKKKKKDTKKSKIPSENDISAPNAEINTKIGLLRTKYTCHANDGSDYCWVSGEEKQHIALGHAHFNLWAAAWAKGDADADTPPNHAIFSGEGNGGRAPPSILQKRSAAPTINISFDGLADLLRPAPAPAAGPPHHTNEPQMLLPPNTQPGEPMLISMFCVTYNLDDSILEKLTTNRYKNASYNTQRLNRHILSSLSLIAMIADMISMTSDRGIRVEIVPLQTTIKCSGLSEVLRTYPKLLKRN